MKTTKYIITNFIFLFLISFSFQNKINTNENNIIEINKDDAEKWLEDIFKCKNSNSLCYSIDKEEKICTKRFMDFLIDSNEIYGPTNLTDQEFTDAEIKYKKKWSKIYPLYTEEMWLFGRGQDDIENIKKVEITKISPLKYTVFIDYDGDIKTTNEVTLISTKNGYKIDYCKTKFLD